MPKPPLAALYAGAVLALGAGVYLLARDWSTVYLLQGLAAAGPDGPLVDAGRWGGSLPSFAHVFAFSLLTALLLGGGAGRTGLACAFWAVVDGLFELGQLPALALAATPLTDRLAGLPVLGNLGPYLQRGQFDVLDLLAIAAGAAGAWFIAVPNNSNRPAHSRAARRTSHA